MGTAVLALAGALACTPQLVGQSAAAPAPEQLAGAASLSSSLAPAATSAGVEGCVTALAQADRSATFVGEMAASTSTQRMAMRIDVQERLPGEPAFHTITPSGAGAWRSSSAGVKVYKHLRQVTGLPAPGSFRAIVRYRWLTADGRLIKHAERRTTICEQPDPRAKLLVGAVLVSQQPGSASDTYRIQLRNDGREPAPPFDIELTVGGVSGSPLPVGGLLAGARTTILTVAARCVPSSPVEVAVDPTHQVNEALGGGLTYTRACPPSR